MKRAFTFSAIRDEENWYRLADSVKKYVKNAQMAAGIKVYTEDYQNVLADIERAESALEKLEQRKRALEAAGTDKESKEWQNITSQIEAAQKRLEQYTAQKYRMEGTGADTEFSGGLANQSWIKSTLAVAGEAMASLRKKIDEIGGAVSQAVGNIPIIGRIVKEAAFIGQKAFEGLNLAMSGIASAGSGVMNVFSKIGAAAKSLASRVKSAVSGFSGLNKSSKGLNVSLTGGFKTLLKYAFGIRSVYMLINKMRRTIVDGFKNLATYSDEVNSSLSMLKSSLNTFKNASAAALAPLLNAMAPALNTIIQLCIKATNAINQLLSALFGKGMWIKAKDQALNFAEGVKKAGKEAQKGARAFDELKIININDDGGDGGSTNPSDMFETVPIDDKFKDWADRLKDMWANADFTELGSAIGDWLKNALDSIPWDSIKESASKLGSSLATLINGFVGTEGLGYSIGNTLAQAVNTGFEFLNSFVHTLDWGAVGQFMAESLNGLFENLDWILITDTFMTGAKGFGDAINSFTEYLNWDAISTTISNFVNTFVDTIYTFVTTTDWSTLGEKIGKTISNAWTGIDWTTVGATVGESFKAFFDFISSAVENVDWWQVGEDVKNFLTGIDWDGVADSFFEAVGAAFGGLAAFLGGLIAENVVSAGEYFQNKIEEAGGNVVEGILVGIAEALVNIGSWINEHIFKPFIDGFKAAFGIHSPSTVMQEQGGFIMQGLLDGISSLVQSVIDIFNSIKEKIVVVWGAIKTKTSEIWNGIKIFVSGLWTGLKTNVSNAFGSIKTIITNIWNGIKTVTTNVWNGIKNAVKTPINAIIGFINSMVTGIVSGLNGMIDAVNGLHFDLPDWLPLVGGKSLGFTIPKISAPQIPMLATGAVFRGGNPYMAIVNDQPRGQTNIEAPLKTIKQALREELEKFSANVQLAPSWDVGEFQLAPPLEFDFAAERQRAYQMAEEHIRRQESVYNGSGNLNGLGEQEIYDIMYSAFTAAMNNNKRLREIDEHVEKGHVIEANGRAFAKLVQTEANETFRRTGKPYFAF